MSLADLMKIPGIIGAYVCDPKGQVLSRYFLDDVEDEMLAKANSFLYEAVEFIKNNQMHVHKIEFEYELGKVIIRLFEKYYVLVMSRGETDLDQIDEQINSQYR